MAIYGTYSIAKSFVNRYKRKNPSRKHFKVHQLRGLRRLVVKKMGGDTDLWWITYKPTEYLFEVPFQTRGQAEDFVDLLVEELKKQAGK